MLAGTGGGAILSAWTGVAAGDTRALPAVTMATSRRGPRARYILGFIVFSYVVWTADAGGTATQAQFSIPNEGGQPLEASTGPRAGRSWWGAEQLMYRGVALENEVSQATEGAFR